MRSLSPSRTFTCTRTVSPALIAGRSASCDFSTSSIAPISRSFKLSQQLQFFFVQDRNIQEIRPSIEGAAQRLPLPPPANLRMVPGQQHLRDLEHALTLGQGRRAANVDRDLRRPRVLRKVEQAAAERIL